jgi:peptidoglycan/LPS O-acetylase OafA/YrhL
LGLFDALTFCVHAFRMEIFFLLAGFFARLLLIRHGEAGFAANRVRRVLLPWGIGVALMLAAMSLGMLPAATTPRELPTTFPAYVSAEPVEAGTAVDQWHPWFRHLWFLEYLLIFYLVLVVLSRVMAGREDRWLKGIDAWLFRAMRWQWLPLLLAAMTAPFLLPMESWVVPTPLSLVPDWRLLMYYGLFVGCGWMLHRQPSVLTATAAHWNWRVGGIHMAVGLALFGLLWNVGGVPQEAAVPFALAIRFASALFTWLFVFQIVGAAVLLLNRPHPSLRYLADAAYWCYLVHLPIVFVLQQQVAPSLPGFLRFPLVLAITTVVSLGSYHLFVWRTFLWEVLGSPNRSRIPVTSSDLQ